MKDELKERLHYLGLEDNYNDSVLVDTSTLQLEDIVVFHRNSEAGPIPMKKFSPETYGYRYLIVEPENYKDAIDLGWEECTDEAIYEYGSLTGWYLPRSDLENPGDIEN